MFQGGNQQSHTGRAVEQAPWWQKVRGDAKEKCPRGLHQICDKIHPTLRLFDLRYAGTGDCREYDCHDDPFWEDDGACQWIGASAEGGEACEASSSTVIIRVILVGNAGGRRRMR